MKKISLIFCIIVLIVVTTVTKNSTKDLENKIFTTKENISILKDKYELVLLDYNFFTTPQKLMEYQSKYFEKEFISIDINEIKKIKKKKDELIILEFNNKNYE